MSLSRAPRPSPIKPLTWLLLGLLLALFVGTNVWFVSQHNFPTPSDEVNHEQTILYYYYNGMGQVRTLTYPPLYYLVSIVTHHLLGMGKQASIAANIPFWIALLLGTFGLTRRITNSPAAALLACLLVGTYPLTSSMSRMVMLDFALAGMVALAMWLLVESDAFARRGMTIAFGIVCGLGMLTRSSFVIFLAGPTMVELIRAGRRSRLPETDVPWRKWLTSFGVAMGLGLLIAAYWYSQNLSMKLANGVFRVSNEAANHPDISFFSLKGLLFYPYALTDMAISPWLTIPLLAALPGLAAHKWPHRLFMAAWIVVPYLFFSNLDWKLARYVIPLLPALAVLTATGLLAWRNRAVRIVAGALTVALALGQWAGLTFGLAQPKHLSENGWVQALTPSVQFKTSDYREDIHVGSPDRQAFDLEQVGAIIKRYAGKSRPVVIVRFVDTPPGTTPYYCEHPINFPLSYYLTRENINARLYDCAFGQEGTITCEPPGFDPVADMATADFLIGFAPHATASIVDGDDWRLEMEFSARDVRRELYRNVTLLP
ncbi:MAG TPA: glycosyltransferase family 39 protein [bacterium]|nr:glycosyltransferase family 39 protein [bacterium]